ncbi:RDD family protein, partial [Streptomyces sp. NPDC052644]
VPAGEIPPPRVYDDSDRRPLSAVGGGTDSIVSLEALRRGGFDPVPFSVNPNHVIVAVNEASGLPALAARRRLDPVLFDLNAAGARNGHIPVTAINSLIAVATAVLHGLGPVVMSNERSASDPNLIWNGHEINHQWSKGVEAEGLLRAALAGHAGLTEPYFSLLRPLSELHIARLFATIDRYDAVVTSCNAAFKLRDASARWCRDCPKCRFVFLAMAPFMPRERVVGIFGGDLLADETQIPGYRELLGVDGHKPFECVGEVEESVVALSLLAAQDQWRDAPVVRALVDAVPAAAWSTAATSDVFTPAGPEETAPYLREAVRRAMAGDSSQEGLPAIGEQASGLQIAILVIATALWFAYEVPTMASGGQTLGKRLLRIRAVPVDADQPLGFGRATRRWSTMGMPTLLWFCCGFGLLLQFVDAVSALFDHPLRQALHDKRAQTVVVQVPRTDRTDTPADDPATDRTDPEPPGDTP